MILIITNVTNWWITKLNDWKDVPCRPTQRMMAHCYDDWRLAEHYQVLLNCYRQNPESFAWKKKKNKKKRARWHDSTSNWIGWYSFDFHPPPPYAITSYDTIAHISSTFFVVVYFALLPNLRSIGIQLLRSGSTHAVPCTDSLSMRWMIQ